jgi:hypothetical protein
MTRAPVEGIHIDYRLRPIKNTVALGRYPSKRGVWKDDFVPEAETGEETCLTVFGVLQFVRTSIDLR